MTLKPRNPSRSRPKGRAGGRAGGAGYDFQDVYVAHQLAKLLVDDRDRDPLIEVLWEKKSLDTGSDDGAEVVIIDDAILRFASGKSAYVQVKETSPSAGWSAAQLIGNSIAQQFWQQWLSKKAADRPRTMLRLASRGDVTTLGLIADAALIARTPQELFGDASEEIRKEISALATSLGLSPDSTDLLAFLKCLQAEPIGSASDVETRIIQSLTWFGEDAVDLLNRLVRIVARSKHVGPDAGASFTKDALIRTLLDEGFSRQRLIAAGVLRAGPVDDAVWDRYRDQIIRKFRSFRVYGLQVDRAVYADLPALFVPLRLAEIPADRPRDDLQRREGKAARTLAERLSAEVQQDESDDDSNRIDAASSRRKDGTFDLGAVLAQKSRFAIIGGPGVGKTTTLKWLAITSTLPGEEGRRLRVAFGLPPDPLIPIYVRFRQFAEGIRARGLAGVEGRAGLVADFLRAEFEAGLVDQIPAREAALPMAQYLLDSEKSLFLFDGLDEVADEAMRNRLFESVSDLMEKYKAPRVIVTSRPYAFKRDRAPLDLALFEPLPLDRDARRTFAHQWYRAVRTSSAAPLEESDARARADDLARAADSLADLSEVPLLLSILALVHFNRQGLPVERATLYDHATLAMLGHWERDKAGRDLGDDAVPADWARRLQLGEKEIRRAVEHLAQRIQIHGGGGEFSRVDAVASLADGLRALATGAGHDAPARAQLLLELLVDRAGLVQERSPDVFAFVHLSFQEYLAARSFVGRGQAGLRELTYLAADERQGEVCRLAVAILSADQRTEADERACAFIKSIRGYSSALTAACLLEAPGVRLEATYAETLARATFNECADQRRDYYPPHITARLVWAVLKHTSATDRVLLEILSDSENGFERERFHPGRRPRHREDRHFRDFWQHEMRMTPAFGVVAARPPGALTVELAWVLRCLSGTDREKGGRLLHNLAELLLIEAGETRAQNHIPALVELLAEDERERGSPSTTGSIIPRVGTLLEKLWQDETTRATLRNFLVNCLSLETERRDEYASDLAWAAAKFMIEHDEQTVPDLAKVLVSGLERRSRHPIAFALLKALAGNPTLGAATIGMLRNGILSTDADVRTGCFRVLVDLGLISGAEGMEDDQQGLSMKLLAEPATANETLVTLAENLWSDSHPTAWRAVKSLIDAGHAAVAGIPLALVNSGLVSARAEAMQYLRLLHNDPALSMSIRGALLGGLSNTNAPVATSTALVLAEMNGPENAALLGRIVQALLRNPDQIDESLPHLRRLVGDEQTKRKALEIIATQLGEKPDRRVASTVARMLAQDGLLHIRNLPEALVKFGLHHASDHKEVADYLALMLDDAEVAATTRRALFEGLSSNDGDVDLGCATILWEAGSKTHSKIAEVLADAGLRKDGRRQQAHAWLLDLFGRPKTAIVARRALEEAASRVVNVPRGHSRSPDHAWAIADCLLAARAYHAEHLAKALVIGGLHRRDDYAKTLPRIKQSIAENSEMAVAVEEALWESLADHDADVQWGAVSALVDNGFVDSILDSDGHVGDEGSAYQNSRAEDERVESLSRLWRVLIREAAREPLASTTLSSLSRRASKSAPERRALRKLLDADDNPEVACAAAYRLLTDPQDDLPAAAFTLVKHGLADRNRQSEASRRLDGLLGETALRPVVLDALHRGLWSDSEGAAWAAAKYLLERRYAPNPGLFRALVRGGLLSRHRREAEAHLRAFLGDPSLRDMVIDALNVGMYADEEVVSAPARLLVEAGAPLHDRVVTALNDMFPWQPWVPLALSALTGRQEEVRESAARLGLAPLADALAHAP